MWKMYIISNPLLQGDLYKRTQECGKCISFQILCYNNIMANNFQRHFQHPLPIITDLDAANPADLADQDLFTLDGTPLLQQLGPLLPLPVPAPHAPDQARTTSSSPPPLTDIAFGQQENNYLHGKITTVLLMGPSKCLPSTSLIRGFIKGICFPLAYCLLQDKHNSTYSRCLQKICTFAPHFYPTLVMLDQLR